MYCGIGYTLHTQGIHGKYWPSIAKHRLNKAETACTISTGLFHCSEYVNPSHTSPINLLSVLFECYKRTKIKDLEKD